MSEIKIYTDKEQEDATMASEPVVTYHTTNLQEQDIWECIPRETRHLAIKAAVSDYRNGQCISQNEMNDWIKEKMGW